jgi:hypothetical protein
MRLDDVIAEVRPDLRSGADQEGTDDTGTVRVRVAPGRGVTEVEIGRWWRDRLSMAGLGPAVLAAYYQAAQRRLVAQQVNGPPPARSAEAYARPDIADAGWDAWVRTSLERAQRLLDESPPRVVTEQTITGPARYVRIRTAAGVAVEVLVDDTRAAENAPELVAADLRTALDRADRE